MVQTKSSRPLQSLIRQIESSPTMVLGTIVLFYLVCMGLCGLGALTLSSYLVSCSQTDTHTQLVVTP